VHGILEYVLAVALIVAPFALAFESGAAMAVGIVLGLAVLVIAASTVAPTSLVDQLPVSVHILLDYVLVAALVASPFVFGFSAETRPTAFFIVVGVIHLLVTIGTRFMPGRAAPPRVG
jgi:hypothetical protein